MNAAEFLGGRNLAVLLLRELADAGSDLCSSEAAHRAGASQCEGFFVALRALKNAPADFVRGIGAVVTDVLGCDTNPNPDYFENLSFEDFFRPDRDDLQGRDSLGIAAKDRSKLRIVS